MTPTWLTIYLDVPAEAHERGTAFWEAATGYARSASRGEHDEFATLVPPAGDAHLRVQRTGGTHPGVHVDVHVGDLDGAVEHARAAGAELVARPGHAVMRSPAGFPFCLVPTSPDATRQQTPPADWGTHRSRVDQLTIDIAYDDWERERRFWADLTGWPVRQGGTPEFARLATPAELPVRILLQRLDEGDTHGHVDLASDDRGQEIARLTGLGARAEREGAGWTVMTGPDGGTFCVTDRHPDDVRPG